MKVRLDYVTNSSSSSFIIACKSEKEMVKTVNEELALYSDEVKNTIIEDARNGQRDVSEYIEDAADEYACNRLIFNYEFGICGRKGSWVDKWREKHPDADWFAYEDDAEYKALYKKYYDEKFNEISDKLKGREKEEANVDVTMIVKRKNEEKTIHYHGDAKTFKESFEKIDLNKM